MFGIWDESVRVPTGRPPQSPFEGVPSAPGMIYPSPSQRRRQVELCRLPGGKMVFCYPRLAVQQKGLSGLGDAYSDCLSTVGQRGTSYVFAGTQIEYSSAVGLNADVNRLNEQLRTPAYSGITTTSITIPIFTGAIPSLARQVIIRATSAIDRGNVSDIQSDFDTILQGFGGSSGSSIKILWRPSAEQICDVWRGGLPPAQGVPTGGTPPVAPAPGSSGTNFLDDIAQTLGLTKTTIGIIGVGLGALLVLGIVGRK